MSSKYLSFFNLQDDPFRLTPDTAYFYNASAHAVALKSIEYCVMQRQGFCVITGDPGTGKTMIVRIFTEKLRDRVEIALIMTPRLMPDEFFQAVLEDFQIPLSSSKNEMLKSFRDFLLTHAAHGRRVAIIVDEAQELPESTLEELRLLSNLETGKEKLLQIVLVGQPELNAKLNRLKQLNQRITVRAKLNPFTAAETSDYLNTRLVKAGASSLLIESKAKGLIFLLSHGIPRTVNLLATRGLMAAFVDGSRKVAKKHVEQGARDVTEATVPVEAPRKRGRSLPALAVGLLLLIVGTVAAWWFIEGGLSLPGVTSQTAASSTPHKSAAPAAPAPAPSTAPVAAVAPATATPTPAGAAFAQAVSREIAALDPCATAFNAFNAVATAWKAPPVTQFTSTKEGTVSYLGALARQRDLELINFDGNLEGLTQLGYPVILCVKPAPKDQEIHVALTEVVNGEYVISGGLGGKVRLSKEELESVWHGKALIPWKNYDRIPWRLADGDRSAAAASLQNLLDNAGVAVGKRGEYDAKTKGAVASFQKLKGLEVSGAPDARTLLFLYQCSPKYFRPSLGKSGTITGSTTS